MGSALVKGPAQPASCLPNKENKASNSAETSSIDEKALAQHADELQKMPVSVDITHGYLVRTSEGGRAQHGFTYVKKKQEPPSEEEPAAPDTMLHYCARGPAKYGQRVFYVYGSAKAPAEDAGAQQVRELGTAARAAPAAAARGAPHPSGEPDCHSAHRRPSQERAAGSSPLALCAVESELAATIQAAAAAPRSSVCQP